ncbi:MAG: hypothetical protein ACWGHV_08040 [Stutzerimonas stutzeri]
MLSDNRVVSGGNFHAEPVAFAADQIATRHLRNRRHRPAPHRPAGRSRPFLWSAGLPRPRSRA